MNNKAVLCNCTHYRSFFIQIIQHYFSTKKALKKPEYIISSAKDYKYNSIKGDEKCMFITIQIRTE